MGAEPDRRFHKLPAAKLWPVIVVFKYVIIYLNPDLVASRLNESFRKLRKA